MRSKILTVLLGSVCAVIPVLGEELSHPGGLGADICNTKLEKEKTSGKNYVLNGDFSQGAGDFANSKDMHWGRIYTRKALGKDIPKELFKVELGELNGKKAAHFINEEGLCAFQDAKGKPVLSNVIAQYLEIEKGGNYILSFRASGFHSTKTAGQHFMITALSCYKGLRQKGITKRTQYNVFNLSSEKTYQVKISVPEETRYILLALTLRGVGEMKITDIAFREASSAAEPIYE